MESIELGGARIWCSNRWGGKSKDPYADFNLADHVGDDAKTVRSNRERLARNINIPLDRFCFMQQVHGNTAVVANPSETPQADALVAYEPNQPLVVLTADCAPIVLVSEKSVAVVHAGWEGLKKGIVESAVAVLQSLDHSSIDAFLGPCIRPAHYAFGEPELTSLEERFGPAVRGLTTTGEPAFDLPAAVLAALKQAGVDNLIDCGEDTFSSLDYFSYRRDDVTGRQATVVMKT